jgi:segregation and condensation protein A
MFEGPLDLLLHLVQKHELDILNIPISFITEKYVEYIQLLDELNIDVASEYLVMAATLVHIKSRMLLPNAPADESEDGSEEDALDPRAELVRRLLEYQKYKLAAEQLGERTILGRDVFGRGSSDAFVGGEAPLEQVETLKLLDAFQGVLERTQRTREHQIDFERFSLSEKISELSDRLRQCRRLVFHEIFVDRASRAELIITFLALLEMTRLRLTRLRQEGPMEPIYIELTVADDEGGPAVVDEQAGLGVAATSEGDAAAIAADGVAADAVDPDSVDPGGIDPGGIDPDGIDPGGIDPDGAESDPSDLTASHPADIQLDPPDPGDLEEYE